MEKQKSQVATSGKGNFAWGVAIALILILTLLVGAIYYFFHDRTTAQLEILYADRDELVTSLGTALAEKESINIRYENALISLDEKNTLIATQDALIVTYQEKIEECETKIKALTPNNVFTNIEKAYLDSYSGVHRFAVSNISTVYLSKDLNSWSDSMFNYALLYEEIILENVSESEVLAFYNSIKTDSKYTYNDIVYNGYSSVSINNMLTYCPTIVDNDRTIIRGLKLFKNEDGTYTVKNVAYSLCQFYFPEEIYNYTKEEKYFIYFGQKYYINSFDLFISGNSAYSLLDARTADNEKIILNLSFYRVSTNMTLKLVVYDEVNSIATGELQFAISSYIPEDFFEKVE